MPRKVLHVIPSLYIGGAEAVLVRLLERWRLQDRYEISVCTLVEGGSFAPAVRHLGVPLYSVGIAGRFDVRAIPRLRALFHTLRPDIVHANLLYADVYTALATRGAQRPRMVYTEHSTWTRRRASSIFRPFDIFVMRAYDRIIAVCEVARQRLIAWAGVDPAITVTIPNGIDLNQFSTSSNRKAIRERLNVGEDDFLIVNVGRLTRRKGVHRLLEAAHALKTAGRRFRLWIIGDGEQRQTLEAQCRRLYMTDVVQFLGARRDVSELLPAADLFVTPSLTEAMPMAVLEAMASAVPVVATRVGGIPEAVRDGIEGSLVPADDALALGRAIHQYMDMSPEDRRAVGQRGRLRVAEEYNIDITSQRILRVYDEL